MAYTNSQATPRSDISAMVNQAAQIDSLFIGQKVAPIYNSEVKRGAYMRARLALGELLNVDGSIRTPGGNYNRTNRSFETDTFDCLEYGLEELVDDSYSSEVSRFFDLETSLAQIIRRSLQLSHESRVASLIQDNATFGSTAAAVAYTEANLATINTPADVAAAKLRLLGKGCLPNAIVMSANVFERMRRSTLLQNQVFGVVPKSAGQSLLPGEQDVARALGVESLLVGRAPKNANKKGQAYSASFIWSDSYIAVLNIAGGEFTAGGAARTIVWTKDSEFLTAETYRDDFRRSDILRVRHAVTEKVIDETSIDLIATSFA